MSRPRASLLSRLSDDENEFRGCCDRSFAPTSTRSESRNALLPSLGCCDSGGKGIEPLPLARTRTTRLHVRPPVTSPLNGKLAITFLSHDRASRGRLPVRVGSAGQRTLAIGQ